MKYTLNLCLRGRAIVDQLAIVMFLDKKVKPSLYTTSFDITYYLQCNSLSAGQVAVSAGGTTGDGSAGGPNTPLIFSSEFLDYPLNNSYNHKANVFTASAEGNLSEYYFFSLAMVTSRRTTNITVKYANGTWNSLAWGINHVGNVELDNFQLSRENVRAVRNREQFGVFYEGGGLFDSTIEPYYDGITIFNLSPIIQTPWAMFNMVRERGDTIWNAIGYDRAYVNYGDYISSTTDSVDNELTTGYTVPFSGIYYLSFTIGVPPNGGAEVQLYTNNFPSTYGVPNVGLAALSTNHGGTTMVSRSTMLYLNARETVSVWLKSGSVHSSVAGQEVSFFGFLYRPKSGVSQAWSVSRSSPYTYTSAVYVAAPFNIYHLNEGSLFDQGTNKVKIVIPGVYYVTVNAGVAPTHAPYVYIRVTSSGSTRVVAAARMNTSVRPLDGVHAMSRGVAVELVKGDEVWVSVLGSVHSQPSAPLFSFTGFLVYPDIY